MADDQRVESIVDGHLIRCDMHDGPNGRLYSFHVLYPWELRQERMEPANA